jgi:hypothetical protein
MHRRKLRTRDASLVSLSPLGVLPGDVPLPAFELPRSSLAVVSRVPIDILEIVRPITVVTVAFVQIPIDPESSLVILHRNSRRKDIETDE